MTVECDVLTDVKILSHDAEDPAYFTLAEGLTDKILSAQSTDVDAASGATFSSHGIVEAVNSALEQAVNDASLEAAAEAAKETSEEILQEAVNE